MKEHWARVRDYLFTPFPYFVALTASWPWFHEPWKDEAQAWLLARDSPTLWSLLNAMGYEGTPALWHLILLPLAKGGAPFIAVQILHLFIAWTFGALVTFRSRFARWEQFGILGGYYLAYEYVAIARSYALTVVFLFALASLHAERRDRPIVYGAVVFLLANTTTHGLILAAVISADWAMEVLAWDRSRRLLLGMALGLLGIAAAVWQLLPPHDLSPGLQKWEHNNNPRDYAAILRNGFLPITLDYTAFPFSEDSHNFWMDPRFRGDRRLFLAVAGTVTTSLILLIDHAKALRTWLLMSAGLFFIFTTKYIGHWRHHGLIFVALLYAIWICRYDAPRSRSNLRTLQQIALATLLLAQVFGSVPAYTNDFHFEFSGGQGAAQMLNGLDYTASTFIATQHVAPATAMIPFLESHVPGLWSVELGQFYTMVTWNATYRVRPSLSTYAAVSRMLDAANESRAERGILITGTPAYNDERVVLLGYFPGAADQDFYLFGYPPDYSSWKDATNQW